MTEAVEVFMEGGPLDGARVFVGRWENLVVPCDAPNGDVYLANYVLAVNSKGRFSLKHIATHSESP